MQSLLKIQLQITGATNQGCSGDGLAVPEAGERHIGFVKFHGSLTVGGLLIEETNAINPTAINSRRQLESDSDSISRNTAMNLVMAKEVHLRRTRQIRSSDIT